MDSIMRQVISNALTSPRNIFKDTITNTNHTADMIKVIKHPGNALDIYDQYINQYLPVRI